MEDICARCGGVFEGWDSLLLIWCKPDCSFVCPPCWVEQCKGHHRGVAGVGGGRTWEALSFLLIVWLVLGILGPLAIADGVRIQTYASLPTTSIAALPVQGLVRIQGAVADSDPIAWGGREAWTRSGWTWAWSISDAFQVRDVTGNVTVTTGRWWAVEGTPHPAPESEHAIGSVYLPGDPILVIGQVAGAGSDRHIEILYASLDTFRLDAAPPILAGVAVTAPFPILVIAIVGAGKRRERLHGERVGFLQAAHGPAKTILSKGGRLARVAGATTAVGFAVLVAASIATLLVIHTRAEGYKFGLIEGLVLGVGVLFASIAIAFRPIPRGTSSPTVSSSSRRAPPLPKR